MDLAFKAVLEKAEFQRKEFLRKQGRWSAGSPTTGIDKGVGFEYLFGADPVRPDS